ncbi:hypothetical protein H0H87_005725 [Tephrocybe sp. NHM501043]|nr:hypothetical protein H0H87_005725 [Tephrocybe sp. NHM501043]
MPAICPDGVGVNFNEEMMFLDKEIKTIEESMSTARMQSSLREENTENTPEIQELVDKHRAWWIGIHIPYEIQQDEDSLQGIEQVVTYMCHILMEQLDRRFVLGMFICNEELKVVLCDRSGVMVMDKPININVEPDEFIRIIAGFSMMAPEQLGWDTSMKIYLEEWNKMESSYRLSPGIQGVQTKSRYHPHWVIDVVVDKVEQYITIDIISSIHSTEICTRATVVYEVIKYEDRFNPTETFAPKRYWRPVSANNPELDLSEGEIYDMLDKNKPQGLKHVIAHQDIKVNGVMDSTLQLARCGLKGKRLERKINAWLILVNSDSESSRFLVKKPVERYDPSIFNFVERQHAQLLMPMGKIL